MPLAYEWTPSKINAVDDFLKTIRAYQAAGKKIITTNGCFDLLHTGHIQFLNQARSFGDILVVGLNSDNSVKRIKGDDRPILAEKERAAMLLALKSVDHVVVYDSLLPSELLAAIKPNVHCKAGDYTIESLPEADVVKSNGGEIRILPFLSGYSTSGFIERIIGSQKKTGTAPSRAHSSDGDVFEVMSYFTASGNLLRQTGYQLSEPISNSAFTIIEAIKTGHKILACGNGGSAADAQHFASELVGRFRYDRPAWTALSLSSDPSIMTSLSNDYGFERVFARQISAWGSAGDVLVALSTSGSSPNILAAAHEAKKRNMFIIALTGNKPTQLTELSDIRLAVPSADTPMIQQAHIAILHTICHIVEQTLAPQKNK
jgi:D-sedoheptulose 7-phosphate isomerase